MGDVADNDPGPVIFPRLDPFVLCDRQMAYAAGKRSSRPQSYTVPAPFHRSPPAPPRRCRRHRLVPLRPPCRRQLERRLVARLVAATLGGHQLRPSLQQLRLYPRLGRP